MKALVVTFMDGEKAIYPAGSRSTVENGYLMIKQPNPSEYVNGDWVCYSMRVLHHWGPEEVEQ